MSRHAVPMLAAFTLAPAAAAQIAITLMHDNDEWAHTEREYASGSRLIVVNPARGKTRSEASLGAVLAYGSARLTFAMTEESKRYDQQSERQRFREVMLGWSF